MSLCCASRRKQFFTCLRTPEGTYIEPRIERIMSVKILNIAHWPIEVSGFGLNEARFASLDEVYETFGGGSLAKIRLDDNANDLILECIEELGHVPKLV